MENITNGKNTDKAKGVIYITDRKKWRVDICFDKKNKFLGHFNDKEDAIKCYADAKLKLDEVRAIIKNSYVYPEIIIPNTRYIRATNGELTIRYVFRNYYDENGKRVVIFMHREILGITDPNARVDHVNRDGTHNYNNNIRECTPYQNSCNSFRVNSLSGLKGVSYLKRLNKYQVSITTKEGHFYLGVYTDKFEAAAVYDFWAAYFFKEFAYFNFKTGIIRMLN